MLTLRPARLLDRREISQLLRASYGTLLSGDYARDVIAAAIDTMCDVPPALVDTGTYFVATLGDRIVGAGGWSDQTPDLEPIKPERAALRKLGVDPTVLRQGVGSALMSEIHRSACKAGKTWMDCLSSRTAEPFYTALGYERYGAMRLKTARPGLWFDVIKMRRVL